MGSDIAQAIADAPLSLEAKLSWHLTGNHYPPVDEAFIPVCLEAINLANLGYYDAELEYPNGLIRTVQHCIDGLHLEYFLEGDK
jgi:hypothetical protein